MQKPQNIKKNPLRRIKLDMSQIRSLDAIYREIPVVECKGLCTDSCGPIQMSKAEFDRLSISIQKVFAYKPTDELCPALVNGRCSAYAERPIICRLWGVVDDPNMKCPFDCQPAVYLTNDESRRLIQEANDIGGGVVIPDGTIEYLKRILEEKDGDPGERESGTQGA